MKRLAFWLLPLLLLLVITPGCSAIITDVVTSTVEPGAPGQPVETVATAAPEATETVAPEDTPTAEPSPPPEDTGLQPIAVEDVQILTGWASPIPALVTVSGTWPDLCAQLAEINQALVDDFQIDITLLATAADPECPPDQLGLPFALQIPLNWNEMPEGEYEVTVNGRETTLYIPVIPPELAEGEEPSLVNPLPPTPGAEPAAGEPLFPAVAEPQPEPVPVTLTSLRVNVGVGSPIPVHAAITAEWPSLCAQLATVSQQVAPFRFDITVLAHPGRPDCPPDMVGYGFALDLPLNVVELPEGEYTVAVNGMETTFMVPVTPPEETAAAGEQPAMTGIDLCPGVSRPALVLSVPGANYQITNPLAAEDCYTDLAGETPGALQAADALYYAVQGEQESVVKRLTYDGTLAPLPFTAVASDEASYLYNFVISPDGSRIAWAAARPSEQGLPLGFMWVSGMSGDDMVAPLPEFVPEGDEPRALVPVRFSQDNSTLFYSVQPVGIGGIWSSFTGRYDNLYALRLNTDAAPTLIFDCADYGAALCIGDFIEMDAQVTTLAYVADQAVTIINGMGEELNTIALEHDYLGMPTFGPGGELVFYGAELAEDSILPEMGTLYRVAPPTAPHEVLASSEGLLPPRAWLDATHVVVGYNSGSENWGTAVVGLDGSLVVNQAEPNGYFLTVLPGAAP